jgi:hypothetical protein
MTDLILADVRASLGVELYKPKTEVDFGAPVFRQCGHLDGCAENGCVQVVVCPCGDEHPASSTAYGLRAECEELSVRWTSLRGEALEDGLKLLGIRSWTAEPYDTMATRSTH